MRLPKIAAASAARRPASTAYSPSGAKAMRPSGSIIATSTKAAEMPGRLRARTRRCRQRRRRRRRTVVHRSKASRRSLMGRILPDRYLTSARAARHPRRHAARPLPMLTIKVVSYKDVPVDQPISAEFREEGGTIGRSPESTLLLPDPDRIISRTHAVVSHQEGRFIVRDQGTTVPLRRQRASAGQGPRPSAARRRRAAHRRVYPPRRRHGQRFLFNLTAEDDMLAPITVVLNWDSDPR